MTTRAGIVGLVSGGIAALLAFALNHFNLPLVWILILCMALMLPAGYLSARWAGSHEPGRCALLGLLSGVLCAALFFCFYAAAAVTSLLDPGADSGTIVQTTLLAFTLLFAGSGSLGALGGGLSRLRHPAKKDSFDKSAPQMAMNVSITAVPAALFAALLAAALYPRLAQTAAASRLVVAPLALALVLLLLSQLALTLITPHEARQADHRTGMDEVKMAAFVGIATAPVLAALLLSVYPVLARSVPFWIAVAASAAMSLFSVFTLRNQILPRRATLPAPQGETAQVKALWFGSIAASRAGRLVTLCLGCGLAMVLPACIVLVAPALNLLALAVPGRGMGWLYLHQILVNGGLILAAGLVLSLIYLFYFNLGRWFSHTKSLSRKDTKG